MQRSTKCSVLVWSTIVCMCRFMKVKWNIYIFSLRSNIYISLFVFRRTWFEPAVVVVRRARLSALHRASRPLRRRRRREAWRRHQVVPVPRRRPPPPAFKCHRRPPQIPPCRPSAALAVDFRSPRRRRPSAVARRQFQDSSHLPSGELHIYILFS